MSNLTVKPTRFGVLYAFVVSLLALRLQVPPGQRKQAYARYRFWTNEIAVRIGLGGVKSTDLPTTLQSSRGIILPRYISPMKMFLTLCCVLLSAAPSSPEQPKSFRDLQWKYPRVRTASAEKDSLLRQRFQKKGLAYPPHAILLRAFKKEAALELWATPAEKQPYILVHEYRICTSSGVFGPKRRFGDEQVPEGFYELDWFNPQSNFFLSLHISYPNASDRILGSHQNLGGDIFLHGNCASIGCIPITDDGIKEVYWLAVLVHSQGQQHLPIQIFPARLTSDGFNSLAATHSNQTELLAFWRNLKEGYDLFEKSHQLPRIKTNTHGAYDFSPRTASL